jgi:hypothetical protein
MSAKRSAAKSAPLAAPTVRIVPLGKNLKALADSLDGIMEEVDGLCEMVQEAQADAPHEAYEKAIGNLTEVFQKLRSARIDALASATSKQ